MKVKKIIALLLAATMCTALSACQKEKTNEDGITTITWYTRGNIGTRHKQVMAEFNKLLEEKYSMHLEFNPIGSYNEKMNVMLAAQDEMDLLYVGGAGSMQDWAKNGALVDITELLPKYAPKLYASMDENVWKAASIDGRIYTTPNWQIQARSAVVVFPTNMLEETGFTTDDFSKPEDLDKYMVAVNKVKPEANELLATAFTHEAYGFVGSYANDPLTVFDIEYCENGEKPEIVCAYFEKEFEDFVNERYDWFQRGLISNIYNPDTQGAFKRGMQPWFYGSTWKPGSEEEYDSNLGVDVEVKQFSPSVMTTDAILATSTAVSATSKHPEKAVEFLEIINNDKELYNMLCFGVEGIDYTKVDDVHIKLTDTTAYYQFNWAIGNVANSYLLETEYAEKWEDTKKVNDEALRSPLLGMLFDREAGDISTLYADCETVASSRMSKLANGRIEDPAAAIEELRQALKDAGIDELLENINAQVDAWWKENK